VRLTPARPRGHSAARPRTTQAFNTFVDDVFAFAIDMPLTHRIACLRDDVVFFVYLYQRWIYPIDKKRVNEFGRAYDDADDDPSDAAAAAAAAPVAALEGMDAAADPDATDAAAPTAASPTEAHAHEE